LPLVTAVAVLCTCAYPLPEPAPPPDLRGWLERVEWRVAGDEAARVLAGYLRVDNQNPPGNETQGARYLAAVLAREGIKSEILEHLPGRGSLVARLEGSGEEKPICLLSHIDTATSEPAEWPAGKGPLSGNIDEEGMIWGRGALDMKGMGAIELMTLVWLKRLEVPLRRDVVLLAVADEEVGNGGMRFVMEKHWDRIGCSHMVNEGGLGLKDGLFKGQTVYAISVAEKGVMWVTMTVRGEGGHGSTPRPGHTPRVLIHALGRLLKRVPEARIHPSLQELFARVGEHRGGVSGFVLKRPTLVRWLAMDKLLGRPGTRAALVDTVNITVLDTGGNQPNVVPTTARARLDIRLLPDTKPGQVLAELRRLVGKDPRIRFEQSHHWPSLESSRDDPFYRALARHAVAGRENAVAGPVLSIGFTDSLFARQRGVRAYGLVPFEVDEDEAKTMHAPEERVSVANVRRGLRVLLGAVIEVSADLTRTGRGATVRPPPFKPVRPDAPAQRAPNIKETAPARPATQPASAPSSRPANPKR
jgi:acetylornithine deacetylase/succinyl-diaminopimelate desuccinylase-like protein